MKNIKKIFTLVLAVMLVMTSCEDDTPGLGRKLDKSELDFDVIQNLSIDPGGNTVIMRNNTPGTVSMWDYGTGRSNKVQ
ncbi:MAG TPA: hypothetical protein VD816_08900, partial [Ohtaekwangia sp.]|nr:hypothetical protein [Ohtaekwangia sp.]